MPTIEERVQVLEDARKKRPTADPPREAIYYKLLRFCEEHRLDPAAIHWAMDLAGVRSGEDYERLLDQRGQP